MTFSSSLLFVATTWRSLRQKCLDIRSNMSLGTVSHAVQMYCFSSAIVCGVWRYTKSFRYPERKKVWGSQVWRIRKPCSAISCTHVVIPLTEMSVHETIRCRRLKWTNTILHKPGDIRTVLQSSMNPYKFFQNFNISYRIYRLLSKKWPYYSFEGNRSPYHYFWCIQEWRFSNIRIFASQIREFCLLIKASRWIYDSFENHMSPTSKSPSSTSCSIALAKL